MARKYPDPGRVADEAKFLKEKYPKMGAQKKTAPKKPKKMTCPGCTTPATCKAQGKCRLSGKSL